MTAAEKNFKDSSGLRDSEKKSRVSEVEDLRGCLIICLGKGCRGFFRAGIVGLEKVQTRSLSSDASSAAEQISYNSAESTLNVLEGCAEGHWQIHRHNLSEEGDL